MTHRAYVATELERLSQKSWRPTELHERIADLKKDKYAIAILYQQYDTDEIYRILAITIETIVIHIILPRGTKETDGTFTPRIPAKIQATASLTAEHYRVLGNLLTKLCEHNDHHS